MRRMHSTGAGGSPYIIRGGLSGRERLRVISRVMQPTTQALLDRVGVPEGAQCLDAGCGGGDVALELAARAGAAGRVVGIDFDEEKLATARTEAAAAGSSVEYRRADVTTDDLGAGFDVVYTRFLLTHLRDPAGACDRLRRALRPGGAVAVEDIDYSGSFSHPDSPAYRRYCEVYVATARARGVDPHIGPRLPALLRDAGFEQVRVSVVQPVGVAPDGSEGDAKLGCALTLENIADAAVAAGVAQREELDRVTDELYRLAADAVTLLSFPRMVQAWARRPA
jgi:ubiquinone/menaquinone biosynthesis C-methylase UbiE